MADNIIDKYFLALPTIITLESSSICQLKCPECPTGRGENKTSEIGRGILKFGLFQTILDNNKWIKRISLVNWGEMFLNKELPAIIKYASQKKVTLEAFGGVNFNTVSDEVLEAMVRYGFGTLRISIDGTTQESYAKYRIAGNISDVFRNVEKLIELKKKYNSKQPEINWKYIIFGHNEHEIIDAKKMAARLGIPIEFKVQWHDQYSPLKNPEKVKSDSGLAIISNNENKNKTGRRSGVLDECGCLWNMPIINWDGKILGCCVNTWGTFGNADLNDLEKSINNDKMIYARKMLAGQVESDDSIPCARCHNYMEFKENGQYLTREEIIGFNRAGIIRSVLGRKFSLQFMRWIYPALRSIRKKLPVAD